MHAERYRFGIFEADCASGELRRQGMRVKIHAQPMQLLCLLLRRPNEVVTREEIARELWPEGTFVEFEHGVNSAMNRIREALGDKAANPRFVETVARRGYRFIAPVSKVNDPAGEDVTASAPVEVREQTPVASEFRVLASESELPEASHAVVRALMIGLQVMYLAFYIGALANLDEIETLLGPLRGAGIWVSAIAVTGAVMIAVRAFTLSGITFRAPGMRKKVLQLWPLTMVMDLLWSLSPFLLLHHIPVGLAFAFCSLLVYSPFAQRSLVLMGAAGPSNVAR